MRILELNIKNYRAFKDEISFNFKQNLTVIAGVNGRGKTAILESLALILSRLLPQISFAKSGYRPLKPTDVHEGQRIFSIAIKVNCAGIPIEYELVQDFNLNKTIVSKLAPAVIESIKNAYGDPSRSDDQAPLAVYYTTDRAGYWFPRKAPQAVSFGQAMAYNGALSNRTVDYKDFIARFRVVSTPIEDNSGYGRIWREKTLSAINAAIEQFMEGITNVEIEHAPPKLLIQKGNEILDIRQLSDGERSLLAMISDLGRRLALANPELENPLHGAGVVLIDEIELHLHPKWQLEIAEKLRSIFPNIQFIVTTHSPFILQTIREGEMISLDKEILPVDPTGKSLEEVAKYVMDIKNTEYSPRIKSMRETARLYMELAEEAKVAEDERKAEIQQQLIQLLAPFTDNPAYTALLESKGIIQPNE